MANILSRIWNFITGCIRRELDQEIERVIEQHEGHHALAHSQSAPIIIQNWSNSPNISPAMLRRNAVSDLSQIEGYEQFRQSLGL